MAKQTSNQTSAPSSPQEVFMTLDGKAVLITGASRGLGAALSRQLAAAGARLVLVARDREPLERLANELREQGAEAHALSADIGDKTTIHPLASTAAELVEPID
ncbi:MAG TPA: SDR family NAD(P)-dependent oxidoreductase, partial [Polyangiaceae bacterium]|nr:SDR family NAD(P)-dependent oxidoreductase [Polyangiaceae bacterium]